MKNIEKVFSEIKTPDSWKAGLYDKINAGQTASCFRHKRIGTVISAAAAVFAVTITAAAVTGLLDLGGIMRNNFNDEVSAVKLETGGYQSLDGFAENDLLSVKTAAFMGDYVDSYVLLSVKPKTDKDIKRFAIDVRAVSETVTDREKYYDGRYYGVPETDENGELSYIFMVRIAPYHSRNAVENNADIILDITHICYETDDFVSFARQKADIQLSFTPDENVMKEFFSVDFNSEMNINGESCTVERFIPSDYAARVVIGYTVPEPLNENDLWDKGCVYGERITGILSGDTDTSNSRFKLVADGETIPFLGAEFNNIDKPFEIYNTTDEMGENYTNNFNGILRFEPFDFEAAESVVIEIDGGENIVVK